MKENRFDIDIGAIPATVNLPKVFDRKLSGMIVCHGWGGSRRLWRLPEKIKNKVLGRGMAVISVDLYAICDREDMTYALWADEISRVIDYARTLDYIEKSKVGLFAFSSGTTAAFRCALEKTAPDFIISVATCVSANIGMSEGGPFVQMQDEETRIFMGEKVKKAFFTDCIENAPIKKLALINTPTLILQGGSDNKYRLSDAAETQKLLQKSFLKIYPDGTHSLDNCATEAANDAVNWLFEHGFCSEPQNW